MSSVSEKPSGRASKAGPLMSMGVGDKMLEGMTSLTKASREDVGGSSCESMWVVSLLDGPTCRRTKVSRGSRKEGVGGVVGLGKAPSRLREVLAKRFRERALVRFAVRRQSIEAVDGVGRAYGVRGTVLA